MSTRGTGGVGAWLSLSALVVLQSWSPAPSAAQQPGAPATGQAQQGGSSGPVPAEQAEPPAQATAEQPDAATAPATPDGARTDHASAPSPPSSDPDAEELRAAAELLQLELEQQAAAPSAADPAELADGANGADAGKRRVLYELAATGAVVALGGLPRTDLGYDELGFLRIDDLLRPREPLTYPAASLMAYGEWQAADWLLLRGLLATLELRDGRSLDPPLEGLTMGGEPLGAAMKRAAYIRELSATLMRRAMSLELGRFRMRIADGLVHDDFANGLRGRLDIGQLASTNIQLELVLGSASQLNEDVEANTLFSLSGDLRFSPFEYVGLFVASSQDRSGELTGVLRSAIAEGRARAVSPDGYRVAPELQASLDLEDRLLGVLSPCEFASTNTRGADGSDIESASQRLGCEGATRGSGDLGYLGARFQLLPVPGVSLRGTLVLVGGKFDIAVAEPGAVRASIEGILRGDDEPALIEADEVQTVGMRIAGWAGEVELHYGITPRWDLGGYAFLLSGDGPITGDDDTYRAFVALAPYWVWTSLFFAGGLNQGLYPNRAAAAGMHGRGAAGLGWGIEYSAESGGTVELRSVLLRAMASPPATEYAGEGLRYGLEVDLRGQQPLWTFFSIGAEIGLLLPDDFFSHERVAYRAQMVTTVRYGD